MFSESRAHPQATERSSRSAPIKSPREPSASPVEPDPTQVIGRGGVQVPPEGELDGEEHPVHQRGPFDHVAHEDEVELPVDVGVEVGVVVSAADAVG